MIFHVDMDAFFASIEIRDRPELRGEPVLVGGTGGRGVIAAASYEARRFGCRSAQPTAVALRRCPQAIVLPPRHDHYRAVSRQVFAVFDRYSPLVEGLSIDEAFLDMSGAERLFGPPRAAAEALRREVRAAVGLTCSVGIAGCKLVAKIASGLHKPDQVTHVPPCGDRAFLAPLPIGHLWGVGPRAEARLHAHGVRTIGDLQREDPARLARWLGDQAHHLHRLALADDERAVVPDRAAKSMGHEDTYEVDLEGEPALLRELLRQSTLVADRLTHARVRARRVQLKIRDHAFRTETRQLTFPAPTAEARALYEAARDLLRAVEIAGRRFRLTGVAAFDLDDDAAPRQLSLLDPPAESTDQGPGESLQAVLTAVRRRYGHQALFPADAGDKARPGATDSVHHRPRGRED